MIAITPPRVRVMLSAAVHDPSASSSSVSAAEKRFRVDRALSADCPQSALLAPAGANPRGSLGAPGSPGGEALDWLLAGFSAAVVAIGQSGTGKTFSLFGPGGGPFAPDSPGLLPQLLWSLFDHLERSREGFRVGLSAWEVEPDGAFRDLISRELTSGSQTLTPEPAVAEVRSPADAAAALAHARSTSVNWAPPASEGTGDRAPEGGMLPPGGLGTARALPNRAHAFVRCARAFVFLRICFTLPAPSFHTHLSHRLHPMTRETRLDSALMKHSPD